MTDTGKRIQKTWAYSRADTLEAAGKLMRFSEDIDKSVLIDRACLSSPSSMMADTSHPTWNSESISARPEVTRGSLVQGPQASVARLDHVDKSDIN